MKLAKWLGFLLSLIFSQMLVGCGGGSGNSAGNNTNITAPIVAASGVVATTGSVAVTTAIITQQ